MKLILLTLAGRWKVQDACTWLRVGRTRFQDLRRRALAAAVGALEEGAAGRPRRQIEKTCTQMSGLRRRLVVMERELRRLTTELDIARSDAGPAVTARLVAKEARR